RVPRHRAEAEAHDGDLEGPDARGANLDAPPRAGGSEQAPVGDAAPAPDAPGLALAARARQDRVGDEPGGPAPEAPEQRIGEEQHDPSLAPVFDHGPR